ncbi:MAG: MFS transporter [Hyphomicrobiaceae bacterium]|nr:MAG: MFS transporter [Hyphomicrobiaceae bacterium]
MNSATATQAGETPTRAIALLALASFVSAANLRICDPLLPQIAGELGITVGSAAAVVTGFAVAYGLAQIVVGPLGDARGKLVMVVLGSLWAGVATMFCAAMPSLEPIVLFRFLGGAGAAAVIPLAMAWIGDVIAYERRQPVLARFLSGQILGIVFGQAAGGVLGELIGWRWTMVLLGVGHFGAGLLLLAEMRRVPAGRSAAGRARWRQAAASAYGLLQRPWVRVVVASVFVEGLAMFGAFAYVGAELHQRFGIGLGLVGAVLGAYGAGALLYVLLAGTLVARLGQPGLAAWGSVLVAVGYVALVFVPWLWLLPPAIALKGLGFYMLHNTLQTNATQMAPEARGLAVSLFAFGLFTGQSVGVALAAPIMDRYGARPVFLVAAATILAVAFWFRRQLLRRAIAAGGA